MKLKYYIPSPKYSVRIFFYILIICVGAILIQDASAYTLASSVTPNSIFKCQLTHIYANITDDIDGVTGVDAWVNSTNRELTIGGVYQTSNVKYVMTNTGGNIWLYNYGNNANLLHGNKTVSFDVTDSLGKHYEYSKSAFLVYSDVCVGTNITNYSQIPNAGAGHYTSMLWGTDMNLIMFGLTPWIEYWGYEFYLLIIFICCISVYMKSQKIIEPLLIAVISLGVLATTALPIIPPEFKQHILMLLGICVGSILYKIFKG